MSVAELMDKDKISCLEEIEIRIEQMTELYEMAFALGDNFHYAVDNLANEILDKRIGEEKDEIYARLDNIDDGCVYWETKMFSIHDEVADLIRMLERTRDEIAERGALYKFVNEGRVN